ncbi:hypothetical protein V8F06_006987 [Rhypophila decipiens]
MKTNNPQVNSQSTGSESHLLNLPLEILTKISHNLQHPPRRIDYDGQFLDEYIWADRLDKASVSSLSRTCKSLHQLLQPIIYQRLSIAEPYGNRLNCPCTGPTKHRTATATQALLLGIYCSIKRNPRLGELVQVLDFPFWALSSKRLEGTDIALCPTFSEIIHMKEVGEETVHGWRVFPHKSDTTILSIQCILVTALLLMLPNLKNARVMIPDGDALLVPSGTASEIADYYRALWRDWSAGEFPICQCQSRVRVRPLGGDIRCFPCLVELELDGKESPNTMRLLTPEITPNLKTLTLRLGAGRFDRSDGVNSILNLSRIARLTLQSHVRGGLEALGRVLRTCTGLVEFNWFGHWFMDYLSPAFSTVEKLTLGSFDCFYDPTGPLPDEYRNQEGIILDSSAMFKSEAKYIRWLSTPLGTTLGKFERLKTLGIWTGNLCRGPMQDSDTDCLVDLVRHCPKLETLNLFVSIWHSFSRISECLYTLAHYQQRHSWNTVQRQNTAQRHSWDTTLRKVGVYFYDDPGKIGNTGAPRSDQLRDTFLWELMELMEEWNEDYVISGMDENYEFPPPLDDGEFTANLGPLTCCMKSTCGIELTVVRNFEEVSYKGSGYLDHCGNFPPLPGSEDMLEVDETRLIMDYMRQEQRSKNQPRNQNPDLQAAAQIYGLPPYTIDTPITRTQKYCQNISMQVML